MLFDLYWRVIGLPVSRLKGALVDAVPFSVVEAFLWAGTAATLLLLLSLLPFRASRPLRARRVRIALLVAGPLFLAALGSGQGAFRWSLAPTAWRQPLAERLAADSIPEEAFRAWMRERASTLREHLLAPGGRDAYFALDEATVLAACDTGLDAALTALKLLPGRRVRAVKDMGPFTTTLGLAYGGPAFHDPFFGEPAIVRDRDLPAPHHWRLTAVCHEAAHAKGYTREMDTEILTQLALRRVGDPRFDALADIHLLRKAGMAIDWPGLLLDEARDVRARREEVEARQPVVRALRKAAIRLGLRNDPAKYGERARAEEWNPRHPFFATVRAALADATGREE